jgi:hypothetical protein
MKKRLTYWLRVVIWHIRAIGARNITKDLERAAAEEKPLFLKLGLYRIDH